VRFRAADIARREDHLALEVRFVDGVVVDDADASDARRREILEHRRAETAGSDHEHARRGEFALSGEADFGDQQVAAVAA